MYLTQLASTETNKSYIVTRVSKGGGDAGTNKGGEDGPFLTITCRPNRIVSFSAPNATSNEML